MDLASKLFKGDRVIWVIFMFLCLVSVIEVFSATSTIAYKNAKVGVPYYLYQAGVKLNENRFQVNQPTVDETINEKDDVNTPDKEIQNGNKQEPVIKDTSKGMNSSLFVLALCASAGLVLVRKKA